jgi:hypothetical protein
MGTDAGCGLTRALDEDELYLSHTAHVDGTLVASTFAHLGSFSDGTHQTGDAGLPPVVINDPSVKVDFVFQLVNAGNASSETVEAALLGTAEQLIGIGAGSSTGPSVVSSILAAIPASGPWALVLKGVGKLWDWLTTNCDSPVAVDRLSGPRFAIDNWTDDDPTGTISVIQKGYGGLDSPDGCGSNSAYRVTWFVQHWRGWSEVRNTENKEFHSATSVAVASHNGALHVFRASPGFGVTHSRTFSGADWQVNLLDGFERGDFFHVNALPPAPSASTTGSICSWSSTTARSGRWPTPPTEGRGRHPDHDRPSASPRGSPSRPLSSVTASTSSPGIRRRQSSASRRAPIC